MAFFGSHFVGRPLDRAWFLFFISHIPITLALDLQPLYPSWVLSTPPLTVLPKFLNWYLDWSRDPIIAGVNGGLPEWRWMKTLVMLEGYFQVPCFFIGAWGLWKNDKRVYPLLVAYGASTATTLVPTLNALLTPDIVNPPFTLSELGSLLGSFIPFLLIPLAITVDMSWRLVGIINAADAKKKA